MLKNLSNLGTTLSKQHLKSINGGIAYCQYWDYNSLQHCYALGFGGGEVVECDPTVECEAEP
jgi:hypothetical protein